MAVASPQYGEVASLHVTFMDFSLDQLDHSSNIRQIFKSDISNGVVWANNVPLGSRLQQISLQGHFTLRIP